VIVITMEKAERKSNKTCQLLFVASSLSSRYHFKNETDKDWARAA